MYTVKFISVYYCFISFLIVFAPLTTGFGDIVPSMLVMWFAFILFKKGSTKSKRIRSFETVENTYIPINIKIVFLTLVAACVFYPLYIIFYTGQSIPSVIINLVSGASNYQLYQEYFMDSDLGNFSITKLPYIVGNGFFKYIYLLFLFKFISTSSKIRKSECLVIVIYMLLYSMVGVARGTSFENFENLLSLIIAILFRFKKVYNKDFFSMKSLVILGSLALVVAIVFQYNLSLRAGGDISASDVTSAIKYDRNGIMAILFPGFGKLLVSLYGYFGFGSYFTSHVITDLWLNDISYCLSSLFPNGLSLFGLTDMSYRVLMDTNYIECNALWSSGYIDYVQKMGTIIVFILVYGVGILSGKLSKRFIIKNDICAAILLYYCLLFMISFPVADFISSSSANQLGVIFSVIFYFFPKTRKVISIYLK